MSLPAVQSPLFSTYCCAALLFLTALVVRANDVQKTTTTIKKGTRTITVETFTRNGLTNLIAQTTSWQDRDKTSKTFTRQRVYHANAIALEVFGDEHGLTISAKAGGDVDVGTHFTQEGKLDSVNLMTKDVVTIDHFSVTNGMLQPMPTPIIEKANALGKDIKGLFDPENVRTNSPDEFVQQAQELIKKHKGN